MFVEEFKEQAARYRDELKQCKGFDDALLLWRRTSLPYMLRETDPFSARYAREVQTVYTSLTEMEYGVANEMSSTKVDAASFKRGYPWITNRLDIIASELMKVCQAMQALHGHRDGQVLDIVEFGCGWGNLALPLARAGQSVTAIDIDQGFLDRITANAALEDLPVQTVQGDFVDVARRLPRRYDAAVFQASFHHCLAFHELLAALEADVLKEDGAIYLFSEPVFPNYAFPWGLRFDGESLWAIMVNKWLELGFDQDFFLDLLLRTGFFAEQIPPIPGHLGPGWRAYRNTNKLSMARWTLPSAFNESFHDSNGAGSRFLRRVSQLPSLAGAVRDHYELTLHNYRNLSLHSEAISGKKRSTITVTPGEEAQWTIDASGGIVTITSDTFIPDNELKNGDPRELGPCVLSIRCVKSARR